MKIFQNLLIVGFILLLYSVPLALGNQQIERKKILILFAFRPTLPVASQWARGLRSVFENDSTINPVINFEHLDLTHFGDEQHVNMLLELYRYKYTNPMPDLIIPVLDSSLDLMLKYGEKVFPGVPIVFGGVESQFVKNQQLRSNITGYLTDINYTGTLELALDLHNDTRKVVVIAGAGNVISRWVQSAQEDYESYEDRYEFSYLVGLAMEDLLKEVSNLPPKTIVISLPVLVDGTGKEYTGNESLALITQASTAPVYTFWDVCIGTGIVGGYMGSFEKEAEAVAKLGIRVLKGETIQKIPITQAPKFSYIFDWNQLKRWSITERKLPSGSLVMLKNFTIWDKYKGRIVFGSLMLLFQTFFIFYLLYQRRIRLQAEEEVKQAEVKYRTVADFTYDWEYWFNTDGKLEYVSPSCERISGYSTTDFLQKATLLQDIILQEDRIIWDEHNRILSEEFKTAEHQFRIRCQDGEVRWVEQSSQIVVGDKGEHLGYRSSIRDISRRKVSELEVQSLKDKLQAESEYLQTEIKIENDFENIVGQSEELKYVLQQAELVASTDASVLILGETGTGKELVARAIHSLSSRNRRALIKINCATLPDNLIESELFGREKGAYSGADKLQIGRFELADESTIFLDEIGEVPLDLQSKLLQILESGEFERLGNPRTLQSTARIITATNRDLRVEVSNGRFREDLFYRLNVFTITLPPLRNRKEDIPLLVNLFVDDCSRKMGKPVPQVSKNTIKALQNYSWPGNVRELKHTIERSFITSRGGKLKIDLLKSSDNLTGTIKTMQKVEHDHILAVLKTKNWKIGGKDSAASALDMHVNTLRSRMNKLGIEKPK